MLNKENREDLCMLYTDYTEKAYVRRKDNRHELAEFAEQSLYTLKQAVNLMGYKFVEKYNHGNGFVEFDLVKKEF